MRVLMDACVLYPTVMREMVLRVAKTGAFTPLWSARILEEWARAARKIGPTGELQARAEIAMIQTAWPKAEQPAAPGLMQRLWLPDEDDIHVLAVAVQASADAILTLNNKDFPRDVLAEQDILRLGPDGFLYDIWLRAPEQVAAAGEAVRAEACRLSGQDWQMRPLLKKARLPRLAKALGTGA